MKLNKLQPITTSIGPNQIVVSKKEFDKIVKHVNMLTDVVNNLIDHTQQSDKTIQAIAKAME